MTGSSTADVPPLPKGRYEIRISFSLDDDDNTKRTLTKLIQINGDVDEGLLDHDDFLLGLQCYGPSWTYYVYSDFNFYTTIAFHIHWEPLMYKKDHWRAIQDIFKVVEEVRDRPFGEGNAENFDRVLQIEKVEK